MSPQKSQQSPLDRVLGVLSSFALSCTLLIFLFLLTLFGTLEQVDNGLFDTQKRYFESWFVVHRIGPIAMPLPGGALCMSLLAVNLICGGLVRIRKSTATVGIITVHVGIIVMLGAALVKQQFSEDGHVTLYEGQQSSEFQSYFLWEVAIWEVGASEEVEEFLIPNGDLVDVVQGSTRTFHSSKLPFELTLSDFQKNSDVRRKGPMWTSVTPVVDGYGMLAKEPEVKAEANIAGMHASALDPSSGEEHEGLLWGFERHPWTFDAGGKTWAVDLRHTKYPMPFTIKLEDFVKVDHPGMTMAKEFRSDVIKVEGDSEQRVRIEMNEPLRHGGLVLFQSSWGPSNALPGDPLFSTFSVVRNASDQWPLYSCIIISIGLLLAFGLKLYRYVTSQARGRAQAAREGGSL